MSPWVKTLNCFHFTNDDSLSYTGYLCPLMYSNEKKKYPRVLVKFKIKLAELGKNKQQKGFTNS